MKFETIEGSQPYTKLKTLPPFVKSQDVLFESIFNHVREEMNNVANDMKYVHKIIQSDIKNETEQMTKLDEKLRNSAKRINHIFLKNQRFRDKYGNNSFGSKKFQILKDNVDILNDKIDKIESIGDQILNHFIETDSKLRENHRLLRPDIINERHYPIIFALLKEKHPELFGSTEPGEITENMENAVHVAVRLESSVDNLESEHGSMVNEEQSPKIVNTDTNKMTTESDLISNETEDDQEIFDEENTNNELISNNESNNIHPDKQEERELREPTTNKIENHDNEEDLDVPTNEIENSKTDINESSDDNLSKVTPIDNLEGDEISDSNKIKDILDTNWNSNVIEDSTNENNEGNSEPGVDTPLCPTESNNNESIENATITSSSTSSRESKTSVLTTADLNKIKTSLANPFTLRSFKKPSKAQTLTTMENISASDITNSNVSGENLAESLGKI